MNAALVNRQPRTQQHWGTAAPVHRKLKFYLVSPQLLRMRDEVREHLVQTGATLEEVRDLRGVASDIDVVYVARTNAPSGARAALRGRDPLGHRPRGPELPNVRRAGNWLYVRMTLLSLLAEQG